MGLDIVMVTAVTGIVILLYTFMGGLWAVSITDVVQGVILLAITFIVMPLALSLVGAALFGPDSLLCGAAAQDAGGPRAAATATGFVNGVGSVGAILEGVTVPLVTERYGWGALFPVLVGLAVLASLALLPTLRRVPAPRAQG